MLFQDLYEPFCNPWTGASLCVKSGKDRSVTVSGRAQTDDKQTRKHRGRQMQPTSVLAKIFISRNFG